MESKTKAVVFDLYGTLLYLTNETKPYVRLFLDLGLQTPEEFRKARRIAMTEDFNNLNSLAGRISPKSDIDKTYQKDVEKEIASAKLYRESKTVLEELKRRNLKLGLISNLASPYKEPFFDLGLDLYFDKVIFSCEVGLRKPDLRIYNLMIKSMGINPEKILMVGDKVHADVEGSRLAGMNAVHLNRNKESEKSIRTLEGIFQHL